MNIRTVTLPAATSTKVVSRGDLVHAIVNNGTGDANLVVGTAATADTGLPLDAASAAGRQGGGYDFGTAVQADRDINGYSTAGTTLVVLEG